MSTVVKRILRILLAVMMAMAGFMHFTMTASYVQIVPDYLPAPEMLVYISGVFEVLGGVGLLVPAARKAAAWGIFALLIAVLPANIHQAMSGVQPPGLEMSESMLWARIPIQLVLLLWAWWMTRPDPVRK